jgi:Xaa-Pro aminopeptidase
VGICIFLRISFIFGLFFQDRQHDPVSCLDPEFLAQCTSLLIPTHSTYTDRLSRLVSALKVADGADPAIWIAEPGPSTSYFLGAFASSDWHMSERPFLIGIRPATDGTTPHITLLTPEFERLRAQLKQIPESVNKYVEWVSWQESESPYEVFIEHTGKQGGAVMDPMVRSFIVNGLLDAANETHYGETRITDSPYSDVEKAVALIRERKDEREVGLLRCANQVGNDSLLRHLRADGNYDGQMTLHAIRKLRSKMHIGITESQTRAILEKEMVKTGLTGGSGLILFGGPSLFPA